MGEPVKMIDCHTDVILCMSFNTDGSLLTTTCKDKKLRVIEPRSGRVLQVEPHIFFEVEGEGVGPGAPLSARPGGRGCAWPFLSHSRGHLSQPTCSGHFSARRGPALFWVGRVPFPVSTSTASSRWDSSGLLG